MVLANRLNPINQDNSSGIIDYSGRLVTNDNVRHEIALGNVYQFSHHDASLAAGASIWIMWDSSLNETRTSTGTYKMKINVSSSVRPVRVQSWEDTQITGTVVTGTTIWCYNMNRCDDCDASLNGLYHTPTFDTSGNKFEPDAYLFASASQQGQLSVTTPGAISDEFSVHLHPLKKYLFKITNTGDAATVVSFAGRIVDEQNWRSGGI